MATSSIILDIRANTQRALNEFKTFSSQLDNKFLVSGLKLDVVRSALGQINREFQKSLGEQGLASAQSIKAAENQATILTNIYAGFSKNASSRIVEDFSTALNQVATRTGSTVTDIQKTLSISPYLSRSFSQGVRENILLDVQNLTTASRRAGLGDNAAGIINQFLTGQTTGLELQESGDMLSKMLGAELTRAGGGTQIQSLEQRNRVLRQALENIDIEEFAKETGGFRAVLEQFSASLFNPKAGLLGAMKEFTISLDEAPTTLFKETTKLFESIFGPEGFIKTLGTELAKAFGIKDSDSAVRFLGRGIRFITNLIKNVTNLIDDVLNNPFVKNVVGVVKSAFDGIVGFIGKLDDVSKNQPQIPDISKESIQEFVKEIGESVRGFLRKVGSFIRGEDISDEAQSGASVIGTIVDEAGKTILTFFREVGGALLNKAGTIALELGKQVVPTAVGLFTKALSGEGGIIPQIIAAVAGGRLITAGLRGIGGIRQGIENVRGGEGGVPGAINRFFNKPIGGFGGGGKDLVEEIASAGAGTQSFHTQVLSYLSRITSCVCGSAQIPEIGGGGRDPITGKKYEKYDPNAPKKPQPITRPKVSGSDFSIDVPSIEPYKGYGRGDTSFGLNRPTYQPPQFQSASSMLPDYLRESQSWGARRDYASIIADKEMMLNSPYGPFIYGVNHNSPEGFDYSIEENRQMAGPDLDVQPGGKKRRGVRGALRKFGKGALIAGGLVGLGALFAGRANANEIDPMTGEPIQTEQKGMGTGAAWAAVGAGAATGAELGSLFGPWGTLIGGVLGAGVSLMDKGVRDAVVKSISEFSKGVVKFGKDFIDGTKSAISGVFRGIGDLIGGIDWKGLLIRALIPGGDFTIKGLQGIAEFASKLNIFDSIKSGIDQIVSPVKNLWGKFTNWNPLGGLIPSGGQQAPAREVGGPVTKGISYIVGERGPELFTPGDSGTISTNRELRQLAAKPSSGSNPVSLSYNIQINATGMAGNDIAAAIEPAVIQILDDSWKQASARLITRGSTIG